MTQLNLFLLYFQCFSHFAVAKDGYLTLDNFNQGNMIYGQESEMEDFAVLADDPHRDLPLAFTICSSFLFKHITGRISFIQLEQQDGPNLLNFNINGNKNYKDFTEKVHVSTEKNILNFLSSGLPIKPHSWYHGCIGIDAAIGHLRLVINGYVVVDETNQYFERLSKKIP